ncbi:MarR family winged helix-turn-helix transcriptional regulator [Paenibacillus sp.]|uniref:MarR family winged helix-turn-helix transcriptional regulator n=1 Tax=Paenibacillus sp. TaxID=58172 RepID=UPI003564B24A
MAEADHRIKQFEELLHVVLRQTRKWAVPPELSRQQVVLLQTLYRKRRAAVNELADDLQISASATTLAVNRLEQTGHIGRTRDEADRRVVWLELTEMAERQVEQVWQCKRQLLTQLLSSLPEEEQEQFMYLLHKMTSSLQDTRQDMR